ncbi:hypothetical protein [Streptomyces longisporus]|uniref:DinB/UmuC family translesion DNA polymerase n=1 Tax=Streptomyces longisporus TaxID=1948 RepID=UPI003CD0A293
MASARPGRGGIQYVAPSETEQFLAPQPIEDSCGIRRAQAVELRRLGVETIGQLALVPPATALRILGHPARLLQERARGIDRRTILPGRAPEPVRVRADFSRDVLDGLQPRAAALQLVTDLAARLRTRSQAARTVTVTVRMADQKDLSKSRRLPAASAHSDDLLGGSQPGRDRALRSPCRAARSNPCGSRRG